MAIYFLFLRLQTSFFYVACQRHSLGALSSSTFGLAPLFTLLLLGVGLFVVRGPTYRWGVASLCLGAYGLLAGCDFRLGRRELGTVFLLSLFRAATSLSLVIAYQNIASGVATRRFTSCIRWSWPS